MRHLPPRETATALPGTCSFAPSAKPRLGALLSSDDYGSSVEREVHGQVLWRAHMRWALSGLRTCLMCTKCGRGRTG